MKSSCNVQGVNDTNGILAVIIFTGSENLIELVSVNPPLQMIWWTGHLFTRPLKILRGWR